MLLGFFLLWQVKMAAVKRAYLKQVSHADEIKEKKPSTA